MSGIGVAEESGDMATKLENLTKEWNEKVATSVEVRRVSDNLNLHKQKMKRLLEELSIAEAWEAELKLKRRRVEESLKPPLLQLFDKLEREELVDNRLLQDAFLSGKKEAFQILEGRMRKVKQMKRAALIQLVDLLLRLRHMLEEESLDGMEKLAKVVQLAKILRSYRFHFNQDTLFQVVLQELARPDINWSSLDTWEAEVVKRITQELGGLPSFMARLISQLLGKVTRERRVDVAVQTDVRSV